MFSTRVGELRDTGAEHSNRSETRSLVSSIQTETKQSRRVVTRTRSMRIHLGYHPTGRSSSPTVWLGEWRAREGGKEMDSVPNRLYGAGENTLQEFLQKPCSFTVPLSQGVEVHDKRSSESPSEMYARRALTNLG